MPQHGTFARDKPSRKVLMMREVPPSELLGIQWERGGTPMKKSARRAVVVRVSTVPACRLSRLGTFDFPSFWLQSRRRDRLAGDGNDKMALSGYSHRCRTPF